MASNIPRLAVTALAERLRITGFSDPDLWTDWIANDLDQNRRCRTPRSPTARRRLHHRLG